MGRQEVERGTDSLQGLSGVCVARRCPVFDAWWFAWLSSGEDSPYGKTSLDRTCPSLSTTPRPEVAPLLSFVLSFCPVTSPFSTCPESNSRGFSCLVFLFFPFRPALARPGVDRAGSFDVPPSFHGATSRCLVFGGSPSPGRPLLRFSSVRPSSLSTQHLSSGILSCHDLPPAPSPPAFLASRFSTRLLCRSP